MREILSTQIRNKLFLKLTAFSGLWMRGSIEGLTSSTGSNYNGIVKFSYLVLDTVIFLDFGSLECNLKSISLFYNRDQLELDVWRLDTHIWLSVGCNFSIHDLVAKSVWIDRHWNRGKTEWIVKTHWGRLAHICISKPTISWTNFSEVLTKIQTVSFKKMHLKISYAKWWPYRLGLNVLRHQTFRCHDLSMF